MRNKRQLRVWASDTDVPRRARLQRPTPGMVLLTQPNPNGTRKSCQNCCHWMASDNQCWLMDGDIVVPAEAICGYHVFGRPQPGGNGEQTRRPDMVPVTPEDAGFDQIAGGVSCDRCAHYTKHSPEEGSCAVVVNPDAGNDMTVHARACCTWWTYRG